MTRLSISPLGILGQQYSVLDGVSEYAGSLYFCIYCRLVQIRTIHSCVEGEIVDRETEWKQDSWRAILSLAYPEWILYNCSVFANSHESCSSVHWSYVALRVTGVPRFRATQPGELLDWQSEREDWLGERNSVAEGEFVVTVSLMCIISLPNTHRVKRRSSSQARRGWTVLCVNVKLNIRHSYHFRVEGQSCFVVRCWS